MEYIVLDLEMNPIHKDYKEQKRICRSEIIQIGAIALDDTLREADSFLTYVKPQYNDAITELIQNLTGITTEKVQTAPPFCEALRLFFDWCRHFDDDLLLIQWSSSDRKQVVREMRLKEYVPDPAEEKIMGSWYDFQEEFGQVVGLENSVSLETAISFAGADFDGRQHDALNDARNTAHLFRIIRNPEENHEALERVISYLKPKEAAGTCLGDLFDFGKVIL